MLLGMNKLSRFFTMSVLTVLTVSLSSCYGSTYDREDSEYSNKLNPFNSDGWIGDVLVPNKDVIDPQGGLSREDYSNLFKAKNTPDKTNKGNGTSLPEALQLISEPEEPTISDDKLVSLMVTEDIPIKEVLIELARRADIDMEIDPNITGGIIFSAKDRPFSQVIKRVTKLAGLRYSIQDNILKVERDTDYIVNYRMNLLNLIRTSQGSINSPTSLGASGNSSGGGGSSGGQSGGGGSSGGRAGSTSTLETISDDGDVWAAIELGVSNILAQYKKPTSYEETAPSASVGTEGSMQQGVLSINRQAGIVSILATDRQHKEVRAYLDYIQKSQTSQVLIEAKILEVTLKDEFRSGINWNFLNSNVTGTTATANFNNIGSLGALAGEVFSIGVLPAELFGLDDTSLEASIQLVESFGVSRTLSSPRLHAMNNQHAVLTFAENFVYFTVTVEEDTTDTGGGTSSTAVTIESQPNTVPVGVLLSLQPSIDLEKNEVVMSVRPTLSRITSFVEDPGVAIQAARFGLTGISSQIPIVDVRQLDSVLKIKSGQVMVIGGLMEERSTNTDRGIPKVSKIPLFGNAFKSVQKESETVETVIFIKATIIPGSGVSVEDKDFYKKFSRDNQPFKF